MTEQTSEVAYNRLRCDSCDRKLVHLIVKDATVDYTTRYQATCPFCGDRSPSKTVTGSVCPIPEDSILLVDLEMDDDKTLIRTALK